MREARAETLRDVAERVKGDKEIPDHGLVSKIERGLSNPSVDVLLDLILRGYRIGFDELCRYWVGADKEREQEERAARELLERALRKGPTVRRRTIDALKVTIRESGPMPKGKPGKQ